MYSLNQLVAINHKRQWTLKPAHRCCTHSDITSIIWLFVHCPRSLLCCRPLSSFTNSGCRMQKHGVTFCYSFCTSGCNPCIAIEEMSAFSHYLENDWLLTN